MPSFEESIAGKLSTPDVARTIDDWHSLQAHDVAKRLETDVDKGLVLHEIRARHQKYGHNVIPNVEQRSTAQIFFLQFKNLPIILLLTASLLSYFLGRTLEAIAIFAVVFMTVGFGFFMEKSAERAISSLVTLRAPKAKVLRENREFEINAHDLVSGDIVEFESGDKVPADCRLVESFDLVMDESPLTGESHGVRKEDDVIIDQSAELADRRNMCYMGTLVLEGRAKSIVTAIGKQTEIGKIGELLEGVTGGKTPLERKIEQLGKTLVIAVFAITGLYISIGFVQGFNIGSIILSGIVLAIAAVPEGLPAVATITLAIGVKRMARKRALIRRLASAETLGSVTTICTDKTGTLTKNEPTLREIVLGNNSIISLTGEGFGPTGGKLFRNGKEVNLVDTNRENDLMLVLKAGALCNNSELSFDESKQLLIQGDTTEVALVVAAAKGSIEKKSLEEEYDRLWEDPFDPKTRRMTTVHRGKDGKVYAFIKGSPESILSICSKIRENGSIANLDADKVKNINKTVEEMTAKSYRVLLIAYKDLNGEERQEDNYQYAVTRDAILLGTVGIYDPPRPEAKEAVQFMKEANTRVVLITGDHPVTARAVAKELRIGCDNDNDNNNNITVLTGGELEKMSVERLAENIEKINVFARATPEHKLKIVEALQRKGHVVAMTGDGVNDAPALKQADIGVAMGKKGTDVAKESAELILLDDNFATITHAVELGRLIFANIKKFVQYLFSCNISEVMTMLVAIIIALPFPLLPLQLLWMNLTINTFPALALAAEKGDKNTKLLRPPPKNKPMISRREWFDICIQSSFMTVAAIAVFLWALSVDDEHSVAQTMAFSTLSLAQTWHVLNYSSTLRRVIDKSISINKPLLGAIILSLVLLVIAIYVEPLNVVFELHPLNFIEWGIALIVSLLSIIVAGITMRIFKRAKIK
ncbi:MAG TPA: cation-transporting P-type ATPase [Nitrososphaeraceae archaeon]|nr:cation-transporting P-type ATPase [Nitrososphaeraceae archaeon]